MAPCAAKRLSRVTVFRATAMYRKAAVSPNTVYMLLPCITKQLSRVTVLHTHVITVELDPGIQAPEYLASQVPA